MHVARWGPKKDCPVLHKPGLPVSTTGILQSKNRVDTPHRSPARGGFTSRATRWSWSPCRPLCFKINLLDRRPPGSHLMGRSSWQPSAATDSAATSSPRGRPPTRRYPGGSGLVCLGGFFVANWATRRRVLGRVFTIGRHVVSTLTVFY